MALVWGVTSRSIADIAKIEGLAAIAEKRLLEERFVKKGDVIGIVAGTPMGIRGTTNFMKFHVIGSAS
jgi:pyruvate kinase